MKNEKEIRERIDELEIKVKELNNNTSIHFIIRIQWEIQALKWVLNETK